MISAVLGLVAGAWVVGQLATVDVLGSLAGADPGWAMVAVIASLIPLLGAALSVAAFTPGRVPPGRVLAAQLATSFLGVVLPPSVGQVAVNARFLHQLGHPPAVIAASVGLTQLCGLAVTVALLAGSLAVTGGAAAVLPGSAIWVSAVWVVSGIAVIAALGVALAPVAVPGLQRRLSPRVLGALAGAQPRLRELTGHPARLSAGLGGNLLVTAGLVATLDASLRAFGVDLPFAQTAIVLLAGTVVGSAAPTPGGIGAVEAALTAGLVTAGVPTAAALPAVLGFRLASLWLRVPAGWLAFTLLQRRGAL